MPNVAAVLKSEIERVARKQTKSSLDALHEADRVRRSELIALRKRVSELERQIAKLARTALKAQAPAGKATDEKASAAEQDLRWRHEGFASHRARLGLSQADMARLIGCSTLSVYKWETGKARPRRAQLAAIAEMRKLTKTRALEKLQQLSVTG